MATPEALGGRRDVTAKAATPGQHLRQEAQRRSHGRRCAYVVDDDPDTRHLIGDVATELGWETKRFASLREVRSALADESPDVLILDDDLPDGTGGEFAVEVRADDRLRRTPIIFCTGAAMHRVREIGRLAPVVMKPFDLRVLERLLGEVAGAA